MNTGGFSTEWSGRLPTDSGAGTQQSRGPKPAGKAAIYHEQFGAANASERPWAYGPPKGMKPGGVDRAARVNQNSCSGSKPRGISFSATCAKAS